MKVRVVKCSNHNAWYNNSIGCTFEVTGKSRPVGNSKGYYLVFPVGWWINEKDAVEASIPESTLEWLQSRQKELQDYVIQCMEYGDEIRKDVTSEYHRNQQRILEIEKC